MSPHYCRCGGRLAIQRKILESNGSIRRRLRCRSCRRSCWTIEVYDAHTVAAVMTSTTGVVVEAGVAETVMNQLGINGCQAVAQLQRSEEKP